MNADIAKQWVEALRSGDYVQGGGALRRDGKHCCLGVLCDLAVEAGVIPEPVMTDHHEFVYGGKYALLPNSVMVWSGMKTAGGAFRNPDEPEPFNLTGLNDSPVSFEVIAKTIEEYQEVM